MAKSIEGIGLQPSSNPFIDDDEEVDNFLFLNHPHQGSSGYMLGGSAGSYQNSEWEQRRQQLLDERRHVEERTLQSSNISLGLLHETEQVGIATAEELVRQGEQLKNVEYKVDEVNSTLRTSQKHLNVMKSIFGGIKSYFSRGTPETTTRPPTVFEDEDPSKPESRLWRAVETSRMDNETTAKDGLSHPALRIRGIDASGFAAALEDDSPSRTWAATSPQASFSAQVDKQLDQNLDELSSGLGRLKNLAMGLGEELDEQSETLDRLGNKVERADVTLHHQNRQIKKILKN